MKKIIIGIILFASFYLINNYIGGADGLLLIKKWIIRHLSFLPLEYSKSIATILTTILSLFMVYCFVSGLFRIATFNQYIPVFQDTSEGGIIVRGHENYPNINRVLRYRESRMAGLSSDKAADLYIATSKVDSLYSGYDNGNETQRVLSYIEGKLCGMSSDRGLNFLANKL
jgi:hypothetical protein